MTTAGLHSEMERLGLLSLDRRIGAQLSFNRSLRRTSQKLNGMWLPEQKTLYNSKGRRRDLEMIGELWQLPKEVTDRTINLVDVPTKLKKKYKRAVQVHGVALKMEDDEGTIVYEGLPSDKQGEHSVRGDHLISNSTAMLDKMAKSVPTYESKVISDIPPDFRDYGDREGWYKAEAKGLTVLRYWNTYRIATALANRDKPVESLRYVDEALSLIPPLRKGEIPHKWEVMTRIYRAHAKYDLKDYQGALNENRICLAAIRLLAFQGKVDMGDSNDILVRKTNGMSNRIIQSLMHIKLKGGIQRPLFATEERLDLMEELNFGVYSANRFKCKCCRKTAPEVKLSLCSACSDVWYCGNECAKKAWKAGHKKSCGQPHFGLSSGADPPMLNTDDEFDEDGFSLLADVINGGHQWIICKDKESGEHFEALTDETMWITKRYRSLGADSPGESQTHQGDWRVPETAADAAAFFSAYEEKVLGGAPSGSTRLDRALGEVDSKEERRTMLRDYLSTKICTSYTCPNEEGKVKTFRCGDCRNSRYCSVECQAAAYPDHKDICKV